MSPHYFCELFKVSIGLTAYQYVLQCRIERAQQYLANPKQVHWILEVGTEQARGVARATMRDVRAAMGLTY